MTTMHEEPGKAAPGSLALVQALVNTQYGQGRRAHVELTSPDSFAPGWLRIVYWQMTCRSRKEI
jgi:hypothetical protein